MIRTKTPTSLRLFSYRFLRQRQIDRWLPLTMVAFWLLVTIFLTLSLTNHQPLPSELGTINLLTDGWPNLIEAFVGWPYYCLVWVMDLIINDLLFAARLVSLMMGLMTIGCLWVCLRYWYGSYLALIGCLLLATNSWFLQIVATGTPTISLLMVPLAFWAIWLIRAKRLSNRWLKLALATMLVWGWFLPFLPWLVIAWLAKVYSQTKSWRQHRPPTRVLIVVGMFGLVTVAWSVGQQSEAVLSTIWGIPESTLDVDQVANNLLNSLQAIVWRAPTNPAGWVANLPMLDALGLLLLPVGVWAYLNKTRPSYQVMGYCLLLGLLSFIAISGGVFSAGFNYLILLVGWLIACGLAELYRVWRQVFPVNPLAHLVGFSLIISLLAISAFYQVQRHLVVWPRHQATKEIWVDF